MKTLISNAAMNILAALSILSTVGCLCVSKLSKKKTGNTSTEPGYKEDFDFFQY